MSSDTPRARKNAARRYQAAHPGTPYPVALRAVTPQGPAIIDREYADYRNIAPIYGLNLDTDHPTGGFRFESDWYFDLAGRGLDPTFGMGRWLVTYASPKQARLNGDPDEVATGWLIAYAIDRHDAKTGRLRGDRRTMEQRHRRPLTASKPPPRRHHTRWADRLAAHPAIAPGAGRRCRSPGFRGAVALGSGPVSGPRCG